jgi:ribosomal protein S18
MPQKTNIKLDTYPELVKQWHPTKNYDKLPGDFAQFSGKEVWWKCNKGPDHEWEARVENRTRRKQGCPFCRNHRVSVTNRFDLIQIDLLKEWNYEKNKILPSEITNGTNLKVWWKCIKNHEWQSKVADRVQKNYGCRECGYKQPIKTEHKNGEWIKQDHLLSSQWDYKKNNHLEDPTLLKGTSTKKAWWKCDKGPDHEWEAEIRKRFLSSTGCPFCNGKKVSVTNSFLLLHPEIAREWHTTLNNLNKSPSEYAQFSNKKVWWKCDKGPDHEYEMGISRRTVENQGCPFCKGNRVSVTNRLDLIAPDIARQFDLEKNKPHKPENFTVGSNKQVWWKCDNSEHRGWKAPIAARMRQAIGCYICNQETRFASESRLFDIVKELFPNYIIERAIRPDFLEGLEIDIYLPQLKLAIEYQGKQHYEVVEFWGGKDALNKRQVNDAKKAYIVKTKQYIFT